ncbi:MAG: chorismate-binding protein [Halothiobacillus sp.]
MSINTAQSRDTRPQIEVIEGIGANDFPALMAQTPLQFAHLFASLAAAGRDSADTGKNTARWSILLAAPESELRLSGDGVLGGAALKPIAAPAANVPELNISGMSFPNTHFLGAWAQWVAQHPGLASDFSTELPFVGGWSFYLSYELAEHIEPSVHLPHFAPADRVGFPVAMAQYHAAALLFDHQTATTYLVHDGRHPATVAAIKAAILGFSHAPMAVGELVIEGLQADDSARYQAGVQQILDYLRAGDVFQANLSRAWRFHAPQVDAGERIFQRLAQYNPAPFAAWYRLAEGQIISSSPERLADHIAGSVSTRPIAGTRRRDADSVRDHALQAELRAHPKERAEHVMLIDLERNDLGRVCQPGSVQVDEFMVLESFAHVHHLVSNVRGQLHPSHSVFDLLAAVFPGGTITGCPKVRCMEILAELEQTGRGPYTGSVGYVSLDGRMDSNILIRTVFLAADGVGEFRTGAGIVIDSDPLRETAETEEKARGLLLALTEPTDSVPQ